MLGVINIQNKDNNCFILCLVRLLIPIYGNLAKTKINDTKFVKKKILKANIFFFIKNNHAKIGKQYNISISAFGYKNETPYRVFTPHKLLKISLLISNGNK